ncbi:hypothetical protein LUD75_09280 [Epilithonimonas sp. JDS]|uniref:hypothetical protein n=1 Tax=Epilithonimonas sp. JDS TaxID=2902797 RepID=UPI001E49B52B|nr:hypothetical protein [Epilithonimonas sp. JDS]MCD9854896.1 hypothetical protein [Epilithonimonas sp. JDS]
MNQNFKFIFVFFILCSGQTFSQMAGKGNFYKEIKNYDLSKIIDPKSILTEDRENTKEKMQKAEPIGFIGDDYQRLYIHYNSINKNPKNPYEYLVKGKTKVKNTVRSFEGKLLIKKANIEKNSDFPNYQQGFATCELILNEDKNLTSTGFFKGVITVGYIIDPKNNFRYDALMFYADIFSNNEFKGTWTSYKTKISKKCNWGDYRIPNSGDLDIGAGEFMPNPKYLDKGWKYYTLTMYGEPKNDVELARKKEEMNWWK